ncbi:unnamed protein product, partial [Lepidochelys olivacea]
MDGTIKEALSVVSEDQSIFDPSYGPPHLMKTEVPPDEEYNCKERPVLGEPDWSSQTSRGHSVKRENETVNCSRQSPVDCSVSRRSKSGSDPHPIPYPASYSDQRSSPPANPPSEEKRVIVPADPGVWTQDHVRQWLDWAVKEYVLEEVDVGLFQHVDGKELCKMGKEDFLHLTSPYNADVLLSHLAYLRQSSPTFTYPAAPAVTPQPPAPPPRVQVKTESPYEEIRRSSWSGSLSGGPKGSPPQIQGVNRTSESPRIVTDPYQVLGPTSSRLANPDPTITSQKRPYNNKPGPSFLGQSRAPPVPNPSSPPGRQRPDPAVAVPAGAAVGQRQRRVHHVGGHQRGVQDDRPGRGGETLGRAQEQAQHELRQAEPGPALLLRQEHHDQGAREALRLQVRLPGHQPGPAEPPGRGAPLQVPPGRPVLPALLPPAEGGLWPQPRRPAARLLRRLLRAPLALLERRLREPLPEPAHAPARRRPPELLLL